MPSIASIMTCDVLTVEPETCAKEALKLLIDHRVRGIAVVNASNEIVGVLSEKNALSVFSATATDLKVADIMTPKPLTFAVNDSLVDVLDCLMANDYGGVLIHEKKKLVGLITRSELMPVVLEVLL